MGNDGFFVINLPICPRNNYHNNQGERNNFKIIYPLPRKLWTGLETSTSDGKLFEL